MNTDKFKNFVRRTVPPIATPCEYVFAIFSVHLRSSAVALGLVVGACAVGPNYTKPDAPVPQKYKEAGDWVVAKPSDAAPKGKWWEAFRDPVLNGLVEQVSISNQTVAASEARYRQAVAETRAAQATLFPTLGADVNATRSGQGSAASATGTAVTGNRFTAQVEARWEVDLWGAIRRQVEAAKAGQEASAADLENARLSMQAQLVTNYYALRVADMQVSLIEDTVEAFQTSLKVTQNRYAGGVAAKVDVVQAQAQLLSTQASLVDLRATRASLEHSIAVLMGKAPAEVTIAPAKFEVHIPDVPPGIPSTLLERRPDIATAERNMAAANARIGVAQAAYFPALNLSGSFGTASSAARNLLKAPYRVWSLGADLADTLIDFGARSAQVELARAQYDEQVANYRQAVLGGIQEVEDNLANVHWLTEETKVEQEAVRAARESVVLTVNQYKAGTVSYLNVVTVQATLLNEQAKLVGLLGRKLSATVVLMRALGGTWE
ncbi:MAG TPA: efflux transporter outer membrane subunit [Casimicrobiaceae bacterium]|nr:efflux transporter outer membrane subunit [Casimicrobiaceae bacterium]